MNDASIRKCCLIWKRKPARTALPSSPTTMIPSLRIADNEYIKNEALLNNLKIIKEDEFSTAIDFAPCKCMLVSDKEEALIELEQHWEKRLAGTLDAFRSEPYF